MKFILFFFRSYLFLFRRFGVTVLFCIIRLVCRCCWWWCCRYWYWALKFTCNENHSRYSTYTSHESRKKNTHQPKQKFQLCTTSEYVVCFFFVIFYFMYTQIVMYSGKSTLKQLVKCMTVYIRGNVSCVNWALTLYVHHSFYIHDESEKKAAAAATAAFATTAVYTI